VRLISPLLLILCLVACQRGGQNNADAVRQAVIDRLAQQKMDIAAMDLKVGDVQYNGDQADANITVTLKGKSDAPPMALRYHLERRQNKWVAVGLSQTSGHGGAADPNAGTNPHGGAMPPAAGGAENPHGGMAPAGGASGMPSPHDLPPATKK
jgi:hypothetical protein